MARYSPHKPICQPVMQPAHCIDIMFLQQKDMSESNLRKHAVVAVESSLASFCRYSRIFAGVMEIPAAVVKLCGPACIIKRLTSETKVATLDPSSAIEKSSQPLKTGQAWTRKLRRIALTALLLVIELGIVWSCSIDVSIFHQVDYFL
ncbi:hypothetical protein M513_09652 [Trichuris suis]|uniref:Uncharacterized protein n=1 Tax=Trichuris suis TaxID=68888 RepID=A0A085LWX1_9BILA|nr:hypothetical protein M513_09652 [Trichuris suis]